MDIPEMAAELEKAAEQEKQPDEGEEYEEGIMIRASDLLHFQDTLLDIRSQIADLQRNARQDRLEVQQMFRAILDRLPPAAGPSAPPPAP
jgi:outer membrane protein TolC